MSRIKPNAFAFLVGINDYSAFDETGGHNLRGAIRDVQHYWRMAKAVGIPAENIRIACAPIKSVQVAEGTVCTGATLADIQAGLDWLASKLGTSKVSAGIVSISAHGSYDATRGSVICASDTRDAGDAGDALTGTLPMTELFARLASRAPKTPVTIFLDACDAGAGPNGAGDTGRALRGRAPMEIGPVKLKQRPDDLLLAASAPGSESYEITVDDSVRGAFSWAALALLERWGLHRTATDTHFDITYGELQERIDALLKAMHVRQRSHFDARPTQRVRKVLGERWATGRGEPNRPFYTGGREVSPGTNGYVRRYIVRKNKSDGPIKAYLLVPGPGCGDWKAGRMYWLKHDGWSDFRAAFNAMNNWPTHAVRIAFDQDIAVANLPYGSAPGSDVTEYATGSNWTLNTNPSFSSDDLFGAFAFNSGNNNSNYVCAHSSGELTWALEKDPGSGTWLLDDDKNKLLVLHPQPTTPTVTEYYEADD